MTIARLAALCIALATGAARAANPCDGPAASVLRPDPGSADARAVWLDRRTLQWPGVPSDGSFVLYYSPNGAIAASAGQAVTGATGAIFLAASRAALAPAIAVRFRYLANGPRLSLAAIPARQLGDLHRGELLLVRLVDGRVAQATHLQVAGALDDLYARAADAPDLGAQARDASTTFRLWAPTARAVRLCLDGTSGATPLRRDDRTGIWTAVRHGDLSGHRYRYAIDVYVRGFGFVRNRVTDPYSTSLTADGARSVVARLESAALKPPGWDAAPAPPALRAATDLVIYELHVRDFSANDPSVPAQHRGKYLAFTDEDSAGMRHLRALAAAGVTDVHLLPVFDFSTVPESGCREPGITGRGDDVEAALATTRAAATDCYNWGYDPEHFGAPEGSYSTDAADGARRVVEFRAMVTGLHRAGLRVGMDMVYNHTMAGGQDPHSVLDRVVPGYYHRLDATGAILRSTCCANTATENRMMAKLMIDTVARWVRDYRIDSLRFDLMGHQPRAAMEAVKDEAARAAGHPVPILGEGWNFGEVADGARFLQAAQGSLAGSGIATFSDRARDAIRGGSAGDRGLDLVAHQGYINGLYYAPNAGARAATRDDLLQAADLVRAGLAGTLASYPLETRRDETVQLARLNYAGQAAGYALNPDEVVNYVENHDNHTLYDIDVLRLPAGTSTADRARVQVLGAALVAFSQGIAYFHAGIETLRSKSLDRNSFDSGDWFNRLDWTLADNGFGSGAPPGPDNERDWPVTRPLLADPTLRPLPADIAWTNGAFLDLLRIRSSSTLFRLRTAADVTERLHFYNTGSGQDPVVIIGHLDGRGYPGARFREILYAVNVGTEPRSVTVAALKGRRYALHPVHRAVGATDLRALKASYDADSGTFHLPPRTAVAFVAGEDVEGATR